MNAFARYLQAIGLASVASASVRKLLLAICMLAIFPLTSTLAKDTAMNKPTIVLVHGAFAESSSWNNVSTRLIKNGYPVIAAANPLRGVKSDADYIASLLRDIKGPIVLVGHSYGGMVISHAANGNGNVKALVYVAAFTPEAGETAAELSARYPGSTLGQALTQPVVLPDGANDLYIQRDKFRSQFAADIDAGEAALMAVTQRPITVAALNEKADTPAWKNIPSWFIFGGADKNIPPTAMSFMAQRANSKKTVEIEAASHVVMVSHPDKVAQLIDAAASAK